MSKPILELDAFITQMSSEDDPASPTPKYSLVLRTFPGKPIELALSPEQYDMSREWFFRGIPLTLTLTPKDGE